MFSTRLQKRASKKIPVLNLTVPIAKGPLKSVKDVILGSLLTRLPSHAHHAQKDAPHVTLPLTVNIATIIGISRTKYAKSVIQSVRNAKIFPQDAFHVLQKSICRISPAFRV